jgi:GntR family transcriptional regulator, transcriptional repressor for pyruvate dehydrogenase complex
MIGIKRDTVVSQVIEHMKEMIVKGELKPNERVPNEYDLAKMFGVGRSSIRETLKIFQFLGVVEFRNPKGTFISDRSRISSEALVWSMLLGKKDFKDLVELRMVLEHQGLWYLTVFHKNDKHLIDETTENMEAEIERMALAIRRKEQRARIEADYDFHKHVIEACHNDIFGALYATMRNFMCEEIMAAQRDVVAPRAIVEEHRGLLKGIREGDYARVAEQFRRHIKNIDQLLNLG